MSVLFHQFTSPDTPFDLAEFLYIVRRLYIWPIDKYKRQMLNRVQNIYRYKYFVETGTHTGNTPRALRNDFEHIYTIELDEAWFLRSQSRLKRYSNITCLHGDSQQILRSVIPRIDLPAIFWLDAHYSGEGTALGAVKAPILQEIELIGSSDVREHIVIVDDVSDFSAAEGYPPLSSILGALEAINPKYKFYFDYDERIR